MSNNINTKIIDTNELSGKASIWETSWQLLHKYKNSKGELIFTDTEIMQYPIFQFNLARWLYKENKSQKGIFSNNQLLKVPEETSDLIKTIATNSLKTHDNNFSANFVHVQRVSFQKSDDDDSCMLDCSNSSNKSSKIIINGSFLEKITGFVTGFAKGAKARWSIEKKIPICSVPGSIAIPSGIIGGISEIKNGEECFAMHFGCCQSIFDEADKKVRSGQQLTEDELNTLIFVYILIPLGGRIYGFREAASLMDLYLTPKKAAKYTEKKPYVINSEVYKTSVIVKYAEEELKKIILDEYKQGILEVGKIFNSKVLKPTQRDSATEGNIQAPDRNIIAEQNNKRLKNADHRFYLQVKILEIKSDNMYLLWYVKSIWDYEPYEKANHVTELTVNEEMGYILRIPDGLSEYLTKVNKAKEFHYTASWKEKLWVKK